MRLSFIIPNYHSQAYLEKCLFSIVQNVQHITYEIIVVNNDPEPLRLHKQYPCLKIKNLSANLGFAKACNLGADLAKGEILFFLNADTELLENNLIDFLNLLEQKNIGLLAPKLLTSAGNLQPWSYGSKITPLKLLLKKFLPKKILDFFSKPSLDNLAWVSGAAMLIKKQLFEKLKGFDENFFMYFEDVDFCLRLRKAGKKIKHLPNFAILHYGGQSAESSFLQKKQYYTSQDQYFQKHFGVVWTCLLKTLRNMALALKKSNQPEPASFLFQAFLLLCFLLPFQFALNPSAGIDLAIIRVLIFLFFLACLPYLYKQKTALFKENKLALLLWIFLGLAFFSILFSQNILWSLRKIAFLLSIFPTYLLVSLLANNFQKKRQLLLALVAGGAAISLFALFFFFAQFFVDLKIIYAFLADKIMPFFLGKTFAHEVLAYPSWLVNSDGITYLRAFAPFPDPHMLSYFTGMLLPWAIALWADKQKKATKIFLGIAICLLVLCDVATFTRGSYLAIIGSAVILLPLVSRKTAWKIGAGILLFLLLFFIVPKNPITSPVASRTISSFDFQEGSNQGRIAIWKQALSILSKNPQGVGIGNYPLTIDQHTPYRTPIYTHNLYLDIAVELGLIGAFVFIFLLSLAFGNFWELAKKNSFYLAGIASLAIFALHCLVESPLYSVHILPLFLIILALSSKENSEIIS